MNKLQMHLQLRPSMRLRHAVMIAFTLFATACGSDTLTGPEDFEMARMRWSQRGPESYTITVTYSCFCAVPGPRMVDVTVRNGTVVTRRDVASGADIPAASARTFPSVDELFAQLDDVIRADEQPFELKFDARFGYPTRVALDNPTLDAPLTILSNLRAQ